MTRAIALLDKPGADSFGMAPVAVADTNGVRVLGLAPPSEHRARAITESHVKELVQAGHALSLDVETAADLPANTVGLWLGESFNPKAAALGIPPAPLPASAIAVAGGTLFLGPTESLYPYLERWTVRAFARFRAEHGEAARREIADLMQWVLPHRPETLAAAWASSTNSEGELELQLRAYAHASTRDALRDQHTHLLDDGPPSDLSRLRLVVFTGGTGVERESVARDFAKRFRLEFTTFASQIAARIRPELVGVEPRVRKHQLMDRGQEEVDQSPLALALSVLDGAATKDWILVVDSLRHLQMRETLTWLQPKKVVVVGVTAPDELRRQRVIERGEDPDTLFRHQTEREIPGLVLDADLQVGETAADEELREIFESVQA